MNDETKALYVDAAEKRARVIRLAGEFGGEEFVKSLDAAMQAAVLIAFAEAPKPAARKAPSQFTTREEK